MHSNAVFEHKNACEKPPMTLTTISESRLLHVRTIVPEADIRENRAKTYEIMMRYKNFKYC
jgi:hypothetical protein